MKAFLLTILLISTSYALQEIPGTNLQTLQLLNNGWFEQAGLPDPTTILPDCYDESTAQLTVSFIGQALSDLANNDVNAVKQDVNKFESQTPQSLKTCLKGNAEFVKGQKAYGINGMSLSSMQSDIESYALFHYSAFRSFANTANSDFKSGNYDKVGKDAGYISQKIFEFMSMLNNSTRVGDNFDTLQQLFNGFFENIGQPDPQHVVSCFDANSAQLTVTTIGGVLQDLANDKVLDATGLLEQYQKQLPQPVQQCLNQSSEMTATLQAYHIYGLQPDQVVGKITTYLLIHMFSLKKQINQANSDWTSGDYKDVGTIGGQVLQKIFGSLNHFGAIRQRFVEKDIPVANNFLQRESASEEKASLFEMINM